MHLSIYLSLSLSLSPVADRRSYPPARIVTVTSWRAASGWAAWFRLGLGVSLSRAARVTVTRILCTASESQVKCLANEGIRVLDFCADSWHPLHSRHFTTSCKLEAAPGINVSALSLKFKVETSGGTWRPKSKLLPKTSRLPETPIVPTHLILSFKFELWTRFWITNLKPGKSSCQLARWDSDFKKAWKVIIFNQYGLGESLCILSGKKWNINVRFLGLLQACWKPVASNRPFVYS
jgi:hypothetical protein